MWRKVLRLIAATVALSAGAAPALAQAVLEPSPVSVDFGDQRQGIITVPGQSVAIANTGSTDTNSLAFSITGADAADFAYWFEPSAVAAGASQDVWVSFTPSHTGAHSANLVIAWSPPGNSQVVVPLAGNGVAPNMVVSIVGGETPPLDFGAALVATASATTYTVRVENTGDAGLVGNLSRDGANGGDWSFSPSNTTFTVAAGSSRDIVATFTPGDVGARAMTLTVTDANGLSPVPSVGLDFVGTGVAPNIAVAPVPVTFSAQRVFTASAATSVTISNAGTSDLEVTSIALTAGATTDFAVAAPGLPATVAPSASVTFDLTFTPQTSGTRTATVTIGSDDPDTPSYELAVSGFGLAPALAASPAALAFGAQRVGTSSASQSFTISNGGNSYLTVDNVSIPGTNAEDWALVGFSGSTLLNPGDTLDIVVTFGPAASGAQDATVVIDTDSPVAPASTTVALSGSGAEALLAVAPSAGLAFGDVVTNDASGSQSFTLTNSGGLTVTITELAVTGANSAEFEFVSPPATPFTISGGSSQAITMRCRPTSVGAKAASFAVTSDADNAGSVVTPSLTCRGVKPDISVAPSSLDFGEVLFGSSSAAQTITVTNDSQSTTSTLTVAVARVGTNPGDFAASPASFTVAPGGSQQISVSFSPGAEGARSAVVRISSDDQETPSVDVVLSGTGIKPEITLVQPAGGSLAFGDVSVSSSSAPQTVTVRNDGSADLTIAGVSLAGTDTGDFSIVSGPQPPPQLVLVPGASQSWGVVFNPTSTGAKSASLRIVSDDANEGTVSVTLSGTGVQAQLTVTPSPIAFPATRVCEAATPIVVELRNTGTFSMTIAETIVSGGVFPVVTAPTLPATLAPDEYTTIEIGFEPQVHSDYSGTLTVVSDAPGGDVVATISGPGRVADMVVDGLSYDFGDVRVDQAPVVDALTIQNSSTAPFTVVSVTLDDPTEFALTPTEPTTYPVTLQPTPAGPGGAGEVASLQVVAQPTSVGAKTATVTVVTDIPTCTGTSAVASVQLSVRGVAPDIGLTSLMDFGGWDVQATAPAARSLTITNPGTAALTVTNISIDGTYAADYQLAAPAPSFPLVIAAGSTSSIELAFQPAAERACGSLTNPDAIATVHSDALTSPQAETRLAGCGYDRHAQVSPMSYEFPPTYRNPDDPPELAIEVANSGDATLVVSSIMAQGADEPFEIVSGGGAFSVTKGAPQQIVVRFAPTTVPAYKYEAQLVIAHDDDNSGYSSVVSLGGFALSREVSVTPAVVPFGSTPLDTTAGVPGEQIAVTSTNTDRAFTVREVRIVDIDPPNAGAFRLRNFDGPLELDSLARLALDVEFTPTEERSYSARLEVFLDGDPVVHQFVMLEGTGVGAQLVGSGCGVAGRSAQACGALLVAVVVLLLGWRRRRAWLLVVLLSAGSAAGGLGTAAADTTRNLDLSTFRPVVGGDPDLITVETPSVGAPGTWAFGLFVDWARNPLNLEPTGGMPTEHPVATRTTTELTFSYAMRGRYELAVRVPLLQQSGTVQMLNFEPAGGSSLGDLSLHGKAQWMDAGALSLGSSASLSLPTASDDEFAGADGPTIHGRMILAARLGRLRLAANGGLRLRPAAELRDVRQGNEFTFGVGALWQLGRRITVVGELYGAVGVGAAQSRATSPLETVGGVRYRMDRSLALTLGVGRGILPGIGAPEARAFVMFAYLPGARGLPVMPTQDLDEEAWADGDDDGDGALNGVDKCPDEPEDRDNFLDADGCPEPDNDDDGILDVDDRCPERKGTPDEDRDGCPDADSDGDTVQDMDDRCPGEVEDIDGYQDDDGCDDPDNDHDGIPDIIDGCALEAESINGVDDDDGCPDEGAPSIMLIGDRVELVDPIRFRRNSAVLTKSDKAILGQVGSLLRAHPEWIKLRVGVHVHPRNGRDQSLSRKRAEAVRTWLLEWGIEGERLDPVGHGSERPLVPRNAKDAANTNDRVEFVIVELAD